MLAKVRARLSYGNITGTLALFIALGGVSYAAVNLPKNSVDAKAIDKNAVRAPEIKKNAVRSAEVKNGSLVCGDIAAGQPACAPTNVRAHTETIELTCDPEQQSGGTYYVQCRGEETVKASCNPGEHATGGGNGEPQNDFSGNTQVAAFVQGPRPDPASGTPDGWAATARGFGYNQSNAPGVAPPPNPDQTVYAVCAA